MSNDTIAAHLNVMLRQVKPDAAEKLIAGLWEVLIPAPAATDASAVAPLGAPEDASAARIPVAMPDAMAALGAVLAQIIMQADKRQRLRLCSVFGLLVSKNMERCEIAEAAELAALQAIAEELGTANGRPI
jgi:hypothetical protein